MEETANKYWENKKEFIKKYTEVFLPYIKKYDEEIKRVVKSFKLYDNLSKITKLSFIVLILIFIVFLIFPFFELDITTGVFTASGLIMVLLIYKFETKKKRIDDK